MSLAAIVDLPRYPIDDPASAAYADAVAAARAGLDAVGCAVADGFVQPEAVERLAVEARSLRPDTHYSTTAMNPYFSGGDDRLPARHPVNTFIERSSGFVPGDAWPPGTETETLYRSAELRRFVADCLGIAELHCFADPLACLTVNVLDPGQQFTWHYDTNDFAVTILLDEASAGGLFEFVPNIRSATDERYDTVQAVLEGERGPVVSLDLRPGDLQIFRGRYSLHRVTRVAADSPPRHAAIFAYTAEPGVIGRLERTYQLFGRALPVHEQAEERRTRSDALRD